MGCYYGVIKWLTCRNGTSEECSVSRSAFVEFQICSRYERRSLETRILISLALSFLAKIQAFSSKISEPVSTRS